MSEQPMGTGAPDRAYFKVTIPDQKVARWRIFFHIFMAIPLIIIAAFITMIIEAIYLLQFVSVLFTGRMPKIIYQIFVGTFRWLNRVSAFMQFGIPKYPSLEFPTEPADPGDYPAESHYPAQPESVPRYGLFFVILAIPHYIYLAVLAVILFFFALVSWFVALIMGQYPAFVQEWLEKFTSYEMRVLAYITMIDSRYPSFSLDI